MTRTLLSAGCLAIFLALSHGSLVLGANVKTGNSIIVKAGEVVDGDLYAFGRSITIEGTVSGDLVAAGEQIIVKGTIEGDLIAAGRSILVEGKVYDDARITGDVLKLAGGSHLGGDLVASGFSLECEPQSEVATDVMYAGAQALFAGKIGRDLCGAMANCQLSGEVGRNASIEARGGGEIERLHHLFFRPSLQVPDVAGGMNFGPEAKVGGMLNYASPREARIDRPNAVAGVIEYRPLKGRARVQPASKEGVIAHLKAVAPFAIFSLLVVLLMPRWTREMADTVRRRPVASFLGSILGLIGFAALTAILIGATLAVAMAFGAARWEVAAGATLVLGLFSSFVLVGGYWIVILIVAPAVGSTAIGRVLLRSPGIPTLLPFLLGLLLLTALTWIPVAGAIVGMIVIALAWGAFCVWLVFGPLPEWDAHPSAAVK